MFAQTKSSTAVPSPTVEMSTDELNTVPYAAGYVPHALLRKYEKRKGNKYEMFIECLQDMAVASEDNDFLEYTKKWFSQVNQGGLFPLNHITYQLFIEIEKQVKKTLPGHAINKSSPPTDTFKEEVIKKIVDHDDVQWHWTLISQCIDSEEHAVELLQEIVFLWVTIRGFSLTATWMELYKKD